MIICISLVVAMVNPFLDKFLNLYCELKLVFCQSIMESTLSVSFEWDVLYE